MGPSRESRDTCLRSARSQQTSPALTAAVVVRKARARRESCRDPHSPDTLAPCMRNQLRTAARSASKQC